MHGTSRKRDATCNEGCTTSIPSTSTPGQLLPLNIGCSFASSPPSGVLQDLREVVISKIEAKLQPRVESPSRAQFIQPQDRNLALTVQRKEEKSMSTSMIHAAAVSKIFNSDSRSLTKGSWHQMMVFGSNRSGLVVGRKVQVAV